MQQKFFPSSLSKAERRIESLKSIAPDLDLGNGKTIVAFQSIKDSFREEVEDYNTHKSVGDSKRSNIRKKERILNDFSEAMLIGVAAKYGKDSAEYTAAGGVRKSERKKPNRSKSTALPIVANTPVV
jgi:hypothetical protein